ncbi:hypothetical protein C8R45DRAFT_1110595 [Mycena sanguinolenta]|nr:hypothetical protein C8R45DRAFT_1110595 [Mycena sanguinolenta]
MVRQVRVRDSRNSFLLGSSPHPLQRCCSTRPRIFNAEPSRPRPPLHARPHSCRVQTRLTHASHARLDAFRAARQLDAPAASPPNARAASVYEYPLLPIPRLHSHVRARLRRTRSPSLTGTFTDCLNFSSRVRTPIRAAALSSPNIASTAPLVIATPAVYATPHYRVSTIHTTRLSTDSQFPAKIGSTSCETSAAARVIPAGEQKLASLLVALQAARPSRSNRTRSNSYPHPHGRLNTQPPRRRRRRRRARRLRHTTRQDDHVEIAV